MSAPEQPEFEGKDLDEALQAAAEALGLPAESLHYEILEQGRRGVFGLGVRSVRIRIEPPLDEPAPGAPARPRPRAAERAAPAEEPAARVSDETAGDIERTVQRILDLMGLELTARTEPRDGGVALEIEGADRKRLDERNGELQSALQLVLNRMSRRTWPDAGRIHLGNDGGRGSERDEEIVRVAREAAQQVARTGRTRKLQPLNAYERRLVHLTVREFAGLTSNSDGRGALKRVRISKVRADTLRH